MHWSASVERALVLDAATELQREIGAQPVTLGWYRAALLARLGPTKAHARKLAQAGDIGTEAHQAIEWLMRTAIGAVAGPEPMISAPALIAVRAFQTWAESVRLKPILVERVVYSKAHRFAGTMDILARVDGVPTEVSIKTGKAVYPEAHLQSAAYVTALVEMGYLPPAGGSLIVRLPKVETDPGFEVVPVAPAAELFPTFLATRAVWEWQYAQDTKRRRVA